MNVPRIVLAMGKTTLPVFLLIAAMGLVGCGGGGPDTPEAAPADAAPQSRSVAGEQPADAHHAETTHEAAASGQVQTYTASGIVKNITPSKSHIVIEHGDIPGFMQAMTMPFALRDTTLIEGLAREDRVRFEITVEGNEAYISAIEKVDG